MLKVSKCNFRSDWVGCNHVRGALYRWTNHNSSIRHAGEARRLPFKQHRYIFRLISTHNPEDTVVTRQIVQTKNDGTTRKAWVVVSVK